MSWWGRALPGLVQISAFCTVFLGKNRGDVGGVDSSHEKWRVFSGGKYGAVYLTDAEVDAC
jgi:hypothetical protein